MHSAPAVSYPVGRSHFQGGLLALIALCGALLIVAWGLHSDAVGARQGGVALLWLLAASWSVRQWQRVLDGTLMWDGVCWSWTVAGQSSVVEPEVTLDFQFGMLLCLRAQTQPCVWVWPERRRAPQRWLPLRRAVFGQSPVLEVKRTEALVSQDGLDRVVP